MLELFYLFYYNINYDLCIELENSLFFSKVGNISMIQIPENLLGDK